MKPNMSPSEGSPLASTTVAALGVAATAVAASSLRSSKARTIRRVEPVSAAAAAAAAAKAAAATGAAKVTGAVAGSAGTGSLKKSSEDLVFDEELDGKKMMPTDRGTPEYEKYMQQKKIQKQMEWDGRTSRNPDGSFGEIKGAAREGSSYDILESTDGEWSGVGSPTDFDPALQVGVTEPLGFFDPAGFSVGKGVDTFRQLRAAEIKHGRVAMMASVGAVVQHYVKFPGFEKVPTGLAAVNIAPGSFAAIALFGICGVLELGVWTDVKSKAPGDFGDPVGLNQYTTEMREKEINNGRAAMFAALGIIAAELNTDKDAIQQFGM
jgi:hypothetical protein